MNSNKVQRIQDVLTIWDRDWDPLVRSTPSNTGCVTLFYGHLKEARPDLLDARLTDSDMYEELKDLLIKTGRLYKYDTRKKSKSSM